MTASTSSVIAPDTYRIDPTRSAVRFTVRGLFGMATVRGSFTVRDGAIVVTPDPTQSRVEATMETASFQTGNKRRDADVTSKRFLNASVHPDITFTSAGVTPAEDGTWSLTGVLTVHGVSQQVTMPVAAARASDGCWFDATATIDRYAFGVTAAKGLVGRTLDIALRIRAVPAP